MTNKKKEPHTTKNGYCCACEYDIAVFENKLKDQRHSIIEEIIEKIGKKDITQSWSCNTTTEDPIVVGNRFIGEAVENNRIISILEKLLKS